MIERIALEVRHLQRTEVAEVHEGFAKGQTGSSAMPHKRNPILSERLCGMSRLLRGYMIVAHENVALWHDRDISHSSSERVILPDAFHITHYMIKKCTNLIRNLAVYPDRMMANLEANKGLCYSQSILTRLIDVHKLSRTDAYALVQQASLSVLNDEEPDMKVALSLLDIPDNFEKELEEIMNPHNYTKHVDKIFSRVL
jgi:adenylosuccinate lyase